jgi:hypothetical protein
MTSFIRKSTKPFASVHYHEYYTIVGLENWVEKRHHTHGGPLKTFDTTNFPDRSDQVSVARVSSLDYSC